MKCLNCQTEIDYQRLTKKYCGARCRVAANRANRTHNVTPAKEEADDITYVPLDAPSRGVEEIKRTQKADGSWTYERASQVEVDDFNDEE